MTTEPLRVLVSDKLAAEGLAILESAAPRIQVDVKVGLPPDDLLRIIGDYHGLAIRSGTQVTEEVLAAGTRLRVVGRAGIGVDNVDVKAATRRGVLVMNTPEGNVVTTAEHAIALMCALVRRIPQATASMKAGKWEKSKFKGRELFGKNLGVIGLGNIGKVVAKRALGLSMKVIAHDPFVTKERARELGVELVSLADLLCRADIVTLHVPLMDGTRNVIGRQAIEAMKPGAFLINAARGGLVDEAAAAEALQSGKLAGAAFDVFETEPPGADNPLLGLDNVVLTPHLGASTDEAQINVAVSVAQQIIAYLDNGAIQNGINAPAVSPELMEMVGPHLRLGRKVGTMAGRMHVGDVREVRLLFAGLAPEVPKGPIASTMLTGLMATAMDAHVNPVNAAHVAQERGISVVEEGTLSGKDYAHEVTIRVTGDQAVTEITGAVLGEDLRIVRVNGFNVEIVPEGHLILTHHTDRPGMIGQVGTILGAHALNISRMVLGKKPGADLAQAVVSIDGAPSPEVLEAIGAIEGIQSVRHISF